MIELRVILLYCAYSFINDIVLIICETYEFENVIFHALSLFTVLEFLLFSYCIYTSLSNKILRKIILAVIPIFISFSFIQYLNADKKHIDAISITVENIIIIIFCLFYFYEEISIPQSTFIYSTPTFWLIAGILIYSAGTFFLFMFSDNLSDDEWQKWSIINYVFTILKNACFGLAVTIKHTNDPLLSYDQNLDNDKIPENNLTINSNP